MVKSRCSDIHSPGEQESKKEAAEMGGKFRVEKADRSGERQPCLHYLNGSSSLFLTFCVLWKWSKWEHFSNLKSIWLLLLWCFQSLSS